jgi:transcriptional regulator GlxA family with amidase domain
MKAFQPVESLSCPTHILEDLSKRFQKTVSYDPKDSKIINFCQTRSLSRSADYLLLVQQTEQYMMEHLDCQLSIERLCAALYVSRRTLHNAFQEVVGVGPMAYLKMQRLKQVRDRLEQAHPLATTVFDTAYQWGFWHMGHFSRDYKQMFGESPSDTLKRKPAFP